MLVLNKSSHQSKPRLQSPTHVTISLDLQTALAAQTHRTEGQWLEDQLNMIKLGMFRVGTLMPIVTRRGGSIFTVTEDIHLSRSIRVSITVAAQSVA
jgi:hypothetical protein